MKRKLNNETLRLDTGCLVAFGPGINYDIEMVKGIKSMLFGGEAYPSRAWPIVYWPMRLEPVAAALVKDLYLAVWETYWTVIIRHSKLITKLDYPAKSYLLPSRQSW